jgi:hypothetical protein
MAEHYLFQIFQKKAELNEIVGGRLETVSPRDDSASYKREKRGYVYDGDEVRHIGQTDDMPEGGDAI